MNEQYRDLVKKSTEKYLRSVRYIISLVALSRIFGKFSFGVNDLVSLDVNKYSESYIKETAESLIAYINKSELKAVTKMNNRENVNKYLQEAAIQFKLPDLNSINRRPDLGTRENYRVFNISPKFIKTVQAQLPNQPWPTGTHKVIAEKLGCPAAKVSQAIDKLIEQGAVYRQENGVVYDHNGDVISMVEKRGT